MNPQQNNNPYPPVPGTPPFRGAPPQSPLSQLPRPPKVHTGHSWIYIVVIVILVLSLIGTFVWTGSIIGQRDKYKNDVDKLVAEAVAVAKKEAETTKEKEYLEREKNPYKEYTAPSTFGSVKVLYPKTWSAFVDEKTGVVGYFHPDYVPGPLSGTAFALRLEIVQQNYDLVLSTYKGNVTKGTLVASPYKLPKVPEVLGMRLDGELSQNVKSGSAVILPLRDKTIKIYTESQSFVPDFNNIILPNMIFQP